MSRRFDNPLGRGLPGPVEKARTLKAWVREILALPEAAVVTVSELACTLPDCPPQETVILILLPDMPPRQISLHTALLAVTRQDLEEALHAG